MREQQKQIRDVLGPAALGRELGISTSYAWQILEGVRPIQPAHARILHERFPGRISKYALCPDVFGDPAEDRAA